MARPSSCSRPSSTSRSCRWNERTDARAIDCWSRRSTTRATGSGKATQPALPRERMRRPFAELAEDLHDGYEWMPDSEWRASSLRSSRIGEPRLRGASANTAMSSSARRLVCALQWVWNTFTPAERRQWVRSALQTVDAETPASVVARLHLIEALHYKAQGMTQASYDAAERAFELSKRSV